MIVLGIVLLVVVGPRELPKLLKSLGQGIAKLRRMSTDLRKQSGIDDIINDEGLRDDIDAIRSLSKGRLIEGALNAATKTSPRRPAQRPSPRSTALALEDLTVPSEGEAPDPAQEYPEVGCDAYGALADDAEVPLPTEPANDDGSDEADEDPYADADAGDAEEESA